MATRAPSPPVLPPAVRVWRCGFLTRPKTLLCESAVIMVCGMLVLTYKTAPAFNRRSTVAELFSTGGRSKNETNPSEVGMPRILKLSLILTGNPCRGPIGLPVVAKCSSNCFARSNACGNNVSVKQEVTCCAIAARLQNAVVTSTALSFPAASWSRSSVASWVSVMASSWAVRRPLSRGISKSVLC